MIIGEFDMVITGGFGKSKKVTLTMHESTLTFTTLGTGSMKRVVKINNEDWVLALSGDSPAAEKDMKGEVTTLCKLAKSGIRVPEPFQSGRVEDILFSMKVYNEDKGEEIGYPAFIQQYLPYVEMDKLDQKVHFAKNKIVTGNRVPTTIQTSVDDLTKILEYFETSGEWGDFQVMYEKTTGYVFVFDPLPQNQSGESFSALVKHWLADIESARDLQRRLAQPRRPRSNTI